MEEARRKNLFSHGPFRLGMMGRIFTWYVEPPPVVRLPAPRMLRPVWKGPGCDVLPRFLDSQQEMLKKVEEANGIDIGRARFYSPYHKRFIWMSLHAVFAVFIGHERRHLWQASRVREELAAASAPLSF